MGYGIQLSFRRLGDRPRPSQRTFVTTPSSAISVVIEYDRSPWGTELLAVKILPRLKQKTRPKPGSSNRVCLFLELIAQFNTDCPRTIHDSRCKQGRNGLEHFKPLIRQVLAVGFDRPILSVVPNRK